MHDHDFDLIAALAEGSLPAHEAEVAHRSIGECAECSAELAGQRAALAAIASAPRPGLTMAESGDLRREVLRSLGRQPAREAPPARRPWWGLVTATAVVIALLALAPLVNLLSTDSGDSSAAETTVAPESAESRQADTAAEAPPATEAPAAEAPAADGATATTTAPATTSLAAAESQPLADGSLPLSLLRFRAVDELGEFLGEVPELWQDDGLSDVTESRELLPDEVDYFASRFSATVVSELPACPTTALDEVIDELVAIVTIGTADFAGREVLLLAVTGAEGSQTVVALDAVTCEVLGQVDV